MNKIDIDNFEERSYNLSVFGLNNTYLIIEKDKKYIENLDFNLYFLIIDKGSFKKQDDKYFLINENNEKLYLKKEIVDEIIKLI